MREAKQLLVLREDLKTAALCDERGGEEHREGRIAKIFSEEKIICNRVLSRAQEKTKPFCGGFVFLIH